MQSLGLWAPTNALPAHRWHTLAPTARITRRHTVCFASPSPPPNSSLSVKILFKIPYRVQFGQTLGVVGSGDKLGQWDGTKALKMAWSTGDYWVGEVEVEPGTSTQLEYKYVVLNANGQVSHWKPGQNYKLDVLAAKGTKVQVLETWDDGPRHVEVEVAGTEGNAAIVQQVPPGTTIIQQQADAAMGELKDALERQVTTIQRVADPAAMEVILGDRLLAAANSKAVAFNNALRKAEALPSLPPGKEQQKVA